MGLILFADSHILMSDQPKNELFKLRHTVAHLLAAAVQALYPDAKRTIGPVIENGFYYDFDFHMPISEADLKAIEKKMLEIGKTWKACKRSQMSPEEAKAVLKNNKYKCELIDEFAGAGEAISFYTHGSFTDLCEGPHLEDPTGQLKNFKLLSLAGAYWRGSEKNKMLTRIYGTAFFTKEELRAHLNMLEEAKKRDHRKLGRELDLFTFSDKVGPGLPLWTPRGTRLRHVLNDFVWKLREERGYERVEIPHITKKDLYETSGHWEKFKDELFRMTTREGHEFALKPMNCPHHTQIFDRHPHSYREMPQRYANTTMVYRDEQTGELHGLSRVRCITQDDAHVFCRHGQIKDEMLKIWDIVEIFYRAAGFPDLKVELSLHDPKQPEKYLGRPEIWSSAEDALREIVAIKGVEAEEKPGEAAFYGPKIDFIAKDSIGRMWQVATIQLDMNMPERFDLSCVNEEGESERIAMVHAAIMGSIERFLSVMIEHHAGAFPLWMAPIQVRVASVGEAHVEMVERLVRELNSHGVRAEVDVSDSTVGNKIRQAAKMKMPYTIIYGDQERDGGPFHIREFGCDEERLVPQKDLVEHVERRVKEQMGVDKEV